MGNLRTLTEKKSIMSIDRETIKNRKIYKYLGPDIGPKIFATQGSVNFKCSFPNEYDDPFELFLSVDTSESDTEVIAYYLEVLGKIPQLPTTCFSNHPDIIPMWTHYGHRHQGIVLEIDETKLAQSIPVGCIEDITYCEENGKYDIANIEYAVRTLKPRHTHFAKKIAFRKSYFTKNICWSYEKERRLVINQQDTRTENGIMLLYLPVDCVTAIITGYRIAEDDNKYYESLASSLKIPHYQLRIGKSSLSPYFIDTSNQPYIFHDSLIERAFEVCEVCKEPIRNRPNGLCNWCLVSDDEQNEAALSNPFRILESMGIDHGYRIEFAGLNPIGTSVK